MFYHQNLRNHIWKKIQSCLMLAVYFSILKTTASCGSTVVGMTMYTGPLISGMTPRFRYNSDLILLLTSYINSLNEAKVSFRKTTRVIFSTPLPGQRDITNFHFSLVLFRKKCFCYLRRSFIIPKFANLFCILTWTYIFHFLYQNKKLNELA